PTICSVPSSATLLHASCDATRTSEQSSKKPSARTPMTYVRDASPHPNTGTPCPNQSYPQRWPYEQPDNTHNRTPARTSTPLPPLWQRTGSLGKRSLRLLPRSARADLSSTAAPGPRDNRSTSA